MTNHGSVDVALVATQRFGFPAQLARALGTFGCRVAACAPPGAPLLRTRAVESPLPWPGASPSRLESLLCETRPGLVVPCDDASTSLLHVLHAASEELRPLLERSLGDSRHHEVVRSRNALLSLARSLGVPIPRTELVDGLDAAGRAAADLGTPLVLKRDGASGGAGVVVVERPQDLGGAWRRLRRRGSVPASLVRAARRRDVQEVRRHRAPVGTTTAVQEFVPGRQLTHAVACRAGTVLASATVEVLATLYPTGPATLVQACEQPAVGEAAGLVVGALGLSGTVGFDFVVEPRTGRPLLLEMNPRATPLSCIPLPGGDVAAALAALAGRRASPRPGLRGRLALFPGELQREGGDPGAADHHLVPVDEPELVELCLRAGRWRSA